MRRTTPPTTSSLNATLNNLGGTSSGDHGHHQTNENMTNQQQSSSSSAEVTRLRNRIADFEEQFAHIKEECNARVRVLEESLTREQSRNRDREEKETSKRQELISKVHSLTEERASLRAQLSQQHDVEDEIARLSSELKESRKECVELKTKALDEKRNFDEQLRDRQRTVEKQAQDISDLQCKLAIVEHKLQLAVARLGQHDSQAESLTDLEEQNIRLSEKLKATERDRRTEKDAGDAEKASLRQRIRELETELHSERDGVSKADIIADYETKIEGAHRMLRHAFANQSMVDMSTGHQSFYGGTSSGSPASLSNQASMSQQHQQHQQQQQLEATQQNKTGNVFASFRKQNQQNQQQQPGGTDASAGGSLSQTQRSNTLRRTINNNNNNNTDSVGDFAHSGGGSQRSNSVSGGAGAGAAGGFNIGTTQANLSQLAEALHLLDDPGRSESLIRRYIDSAIAARTATASFTAASGLPDATSTDKSVLLVQLANVTTERDSLRQKLNHYLGNDDRSSTVGTGQHHNQQQHSHGLNRELSQASSSTPNESTSLSFPNQNHQSNNNSANRYRNGILPSSRTPPKLNRSPN